MSELPEWWRWIVNGKWDRRGYLWRAEKVVDGKRFWADSYAPAAFARETARVELIAAITKHEKEQSHA